MEQIKRIACNLVDEDIMETEYSPVIISHPFFNSGIVFTKAGFANIVDDEQAFETVREELKERIDKANTIFDILLMLNTPYLLVFVYLIFEYLSDEDKGLCLRYAWLNSEAPSKDVNLTTDEIRSMFKACKPEYLMEDEDYAFYKQLPRNFKVFRGTKVEDDYDALSWTLDYETAKWFANRFETEGFVIERKVNRKDVLAFFNDKDEVEIII